jgi:predicted flap endonuclease-1-like 5' DNA nuclease
MTRLAVIEGIGPVYQEKLIGADIHTIEQLLDNGANPAGRAAIVKRSGISAEYILNWVNRADLMRVEGIGEEYSDLLERAGVDTVKELAQRNPENLHQKLGDLNAEKALVRRLPSFPRVRGWVAQAKELPRKITY